MDHIVKYHIHVMGKQMELGNLGEQICIFDKLFSFLSQSPDSVLNLKIPEFLLFRLIYYPAHEALSCC